MLAKNLTIPHTGSSISISSASFRSKPVDALDFTRMSLQLVLNHSFSAGLPVGPLITGSGYFQYSNDLGILYRDTAQNTNMADKIRHWVTDESTRFFISGSTRSQQSTSNLLASSGSSTSATSYPAVFMLPNTNVHSRWVRFCFDSGNTAASGSLSGSLTMKEY